MIERKHHTIDISGMPLGRAATKIAMLLMGKHKPTFERHIDAGDFVRVTNIDKMIVTGNKIEDKVYYRSSNRPGGLKRILLSSLWEKKKATVLRRAVIGMLPKNTFKTPMIKRLDIVD